MRVRFGELFIHSLLFGNAGDGVGGFAMPGPTRTHTRNLRSTVICPPSGRDLLLIIYALSPATQHKQKNAHKENVKNLTPREREWRKIMRPRRHSSVHVSVGRRVTARKMTQDKGGRGAAAVRLRIHLCSFAVSVAAAAAAKVCLCAAVRVF